MRSSTSNIHRIRSGLPTDGASPSSGTGPGSRTSGWWVSLGGSPRRRRPARPPPARSLVAFTREGDVWVRGLADGRERRLTRTPILEGGLAWSPDGSRIAFITLSSKRHENAPEYSGAKILHTRIERGFGDVAIVALDSGS